MYSVPIAVPGALNCSGYRQYPHEIAACENRFFVAAECISKSRSSCKERFRGPGYPKYPEGMALVHVKCRMTSYGSFMTVGLKCPWPRAGRNRCARRKPRCCWAGDRIAGAAVSSSRSERGGTIMTMILTTLMHQSRQSSSRCAALYLPPLSHQSRQSSSRCAVLYLPPLSHQRRQSSSRCAVLYLPPLSRDMCCHERGGRPVQ